MAAAHRLFAALALAAACAPAPAPSEAPVARAFQASASATEVPRDLLVAIAVVEDGLAVPRTRGIDEADAIPTAGPLQLRRGRLDTLRRGAELAGTTELALRRDADLALTAGALVLAELGRANGARGGDLGSWRAAIAALSGHADERQRASYARRVLAVLARGGSFAARDGERLELAPHPLPAALDLDIDLDGVRPLAQAQYAGAELLPTSCKNKCTEGRDVFHVELVVIHDTEAGWEASVATLQNDPDKSVHYIVDTDGRVAQFVTEETTAWHAGNFNYNQRSIGIEHVGFHDRPFAEPEYAASAKLVDHLATKYAIPRDRTHIVGHDQIPNEKKLGEGAAPCPDSPAQCEANLAYGGANHHTDPGIWDWPGYMARIDGAAKCNDAPGVCEASAAPPVTAPKDAGPPGPADATAPELGEPGSGCSAASRQRPGRAQGAAVLALLAVVLGRRRTRRP